MSFSLVLFILAAMGILGLGNISRINDNLKDIYNVRLVAASELGTVSENVQKINTSLGSYLLLKGENERKVEKQKIEVAKKKIETSVAQLSKLDLTDGEKKELEFFNSLWAGYWPNADKIFKFVDQNQIQFATTVYQKELFNRMGGIDRSFQGFLDLNKESAHQAYLNSESAFDNAKYWSILFMVISLLISGLLGYWMTRSIRKPIDTLLGVSERMGRGDLSQEIKISRKDELGVLGDSFEKMRINLLHLIEKVKQSTDSLSNLSVQIQHHATTTGESSQRVHEGLQAGAEKSREQSEKTTNDATVIKEMALGLQQVASSIDTIGIHSIEMEQASTGGAVVVKSAVEKISHVQEQVHRSFETMRKLSELSREIEDVVITIKTISEETNLLSLNASIEAARAGDAGRGFAVVAQEVRKLADNSIHEVEHVREVVTKIQAGTEEAIRSNQLWINEMDEGQQKVSETGKTFADIQSWIHKINLSIQDVSASVEELAAGSNEIDNSIHRIEQFSSDSAHSSQEFAAISEEQIRSMDDVASSVKQLFEITQEMKAAVNRFVL